MHRTLILMRHAKADDSRRGGDRERELTQTGHEDAAEVSEMLRNADLSPDVVLCSDSTRTVQTASAMVEAAEQELRLLSLPELYLADAPTIVRVVTEYSAAAATLLVVGHNPAIETLIQSIDPAAGNVKPGVALVCSVDHRTPWQSFTPAAATARELLIPSRFLS